MSDYEDNDQMAQDNVTFNSHLGDFLTYQRGQITLRNDQPIYLMAIDVAASLEKKFVKEKVFSNGQFVQKQFVDKTPLIQIYSSTMQGDSVCVNIRNYVPYFYAPLPYGMEDTEKNLQTLRVGINSLVKDTPIAIVKITSVRRMSIRNYKPDEYFEHDKFIKIETCNQSVVPGLRKIFQQQNLISGVRLPNVTYESNIPYLLRFMIDKDITGTGWMKILPGFKVVESKNKTTRCQAEIDCLVEQIQALECENQWAKISPLRILSFDIECATKQGFPSADKHQVIQIACVCKNTMKEVEDYRVVFVLNGASPISGAHVKHMRSQIQMLQDFQKLIITYDPDFLLGYNMINFDMKFLLERAKHLGMKNYGYFGRNLSRISTIKSGKFQSKAMGMRETTEINTDGRIQLDMLIHMHKQHKLTSYRLNNVSFQFLGKQKEDVHHSQIYKLHNQSKESRKRLAVYCLKDAELPLKLMEKLCCLYNYCEMARVTGVPINFLLKRGQQIKVVSQLLRKSKQKGYIMPTQKVKSSEPQIGYEGAYVLDPKPGFYTEPIATLDFASLYPSIMRAHNLCYTTLINKSDIEKFGLEKDDVYVTAENVYFVRDHKRKGLLPQILRQLITARKKAKKELAETTDPMMKKVLDGRQLALKLSANSVYGFTGATIGQLPCLEISSSVTSIGRSMIEKTKNEVERLFDAEVIYGDTDSVMVKFPLKSVDEKKQVLIAEAMDYGKKAAEQITKQFVDPIKLEFEKVYCPYLLITKKRYAGVYYTKPHQYDKVDKKGIQTVRRDNCLLIREILEKVLQTILLENDTVKTANYIKVMISDLLQNKIDISKLVITKAISKSTDDEEGGKKKAYKSKQAHTELAEKMKKRDENMDINIGDRIPYVMITGTKWSKNYENAEDPIKVLNEDLPIDYDYYINKQIRPPLERLLKNTNIISNFDMLFAGDHTRIRYIPKLNAKTAMGSFLTKKPTCLNCKQVSDSVVCEDCQDRRTEIYLGKKEQKKRMEEQHSNLLTECNNCQRSCMMEILCANVDCPIFYRRIKVKKELEDKERQMERFDEYMLSQASW